MLELQIAELRELTQQAKTQKIDDMPRKNKQSDISDYIVKLESLEEKKKLKLKEKRNQRIDIENLIADVKDDIESDILYMRYVQMKDWDEIANEQGYCIRQVLRYHGNALHNLHIIV